MVVDSRRSVRKILKAKAQLSISNGPPVEGRTIDIGIDGMGMVLPVSVVRGQNGKVIINMYFDGKAHLVDTAIKVTYCVFSSGEFRVGCQFVRLETAELGSISAFLR